MGRYQHPCCNQHDTPLHAEFVPVRIFNAERKKYPTKLGFFVLP